MIFGILNKNPFKTKCLRPACYQVAWRLNPTGLLFSFYYDRSPKACSVVSYRNVVDGEGVGAEQAVEDLVQADVVDRHVQLSVDALAALVASEPATKDQVVFPETNLIIKLLF